MKRLRWTLILIALLALAALQACDDDETNQTPTDTSATDTNGTSGTTTDSTDDTNTSPDSSTNTTADADDTNTADDADTTQPPPDLRIPGLSGPVQAVYDAHGILHITCQTDDDCIAAMGYFHAANRFFFMDFVRTSMRGRLGQLTKGGALVLARDFATRKLMTTASGEPLEEAIVAGLSPRTRAFMDRYAAGVNAWLADARAGRNGAEFSIEYNFPLIIKDNIADWEPADTAAFALYMFDDLANVSYDEIAIGNAMNSGIPQNFLADFFQTRPAFPSFTVTDSGETFPSNKRAQRPAKPLDWSALTARATPFRSVLADAQAALSHNPRALGSEGADRGSNNWIVGPSRSATNKPILANDPHLALTNPPIWFPIEIDSKSSGTGTFHAAGGSIPGLPAIFSGHNEDIAWGVTTIYYDLADVYTETLNDAGTAVIFNGEEVAITTRDFTFEDHSTTPPTTITQTFEYVPHHGVIVSKDVAAKTAVSVRWLPYTETVTDFDAFFGLLTSQTVADARQALASITTSNQNFVVIDSAGDIGWFPMGKVPKREWDLQAYPAWLPLPGDGTAEWSGFHTPEELPQMINPANDFIATANQDIMGSTADGDPTNDGHNVLQAYPKAIGARQARIVELIQATPQHTPETMLTAQSDTYSLLGEIIVPALLAATTDGMFDPETSALLSALDAWEFTCPTGLTSSDPLMTANNKSTDPVATRESIGCSAFHTVLYEVLRAAYADEMGPLTYTVDPDPTRRLNYQQELVNLLVLTLREPTALTSPDAYWDNVNTDGPDETREQIFIAALTQSAALLHDKYGAPDEWRWGRLHQLSLNSPFAAVSASLTSYNAGPYANDGGLLTVDVANPRDRGSDLDFSHTNGPSIRTVIEMTDNGPSLLFQLPGGTSLDRNSDLFNQLMPNWLTNTAVPVAFGPGAVTNPKISLTVNPAE